MIKHAQYEMFLDAQKWFLELFINHFSITADLCRMSTVDIINLNNLRDSVETKFLIFGWYYRNLKLIRLVYIFG